MQKLKKMLFILLLLISITVFSNTNDQQRQYRIGYTTEYANGQFNSSHFIDNSSNSDKSKNLRRSPEHPDPDHDWRDWWRMNMWDLLGGDSDWPSYVDEDWWDWFFENYGDEYGDYVKEYYNTYPDTPNNPYKTPIGDMPWILGGMFIIAYIIRYKCKE